MSIVVLKLPAVKRKNEGRPKKCPYCSGETFQCWGQVNKAVKDTRVRKEKVYRYRCCHCKHTFRHYPAGVSHAQQSRRLMKLCVIMWSLGSSHRCVQRVGQHIRQKLQWQGARVVGVDGAWVADKGIMVAVDMGDGELLALAEIDEKEKSAVAVWLKALKQ